MNAPKHVSLQCLCLWAVSASRRGNKVNALETHSNKEKSFGLSMFVTFSLIFTYNLYMYLYNLYTFHPSCLLLMPILVS